MRPMRQQYWAILSKLSLTTARRVVCRLRPETDPHEKGSVSVLTAMLSGMAAPPTTVQVVRAVLDELKAEIIPVPLDIVALTTKESIATALITVRTEQAAIAQLVGVTGLSLAKAVDDLAALFAIAGVPTSLVHPTQKET